MWRTYREIQPIRIRVGLAEIGKQQRAFRSEGRKCSRKMVAFELILRILVNACEGKYVVREQQLRPGTCCETKVQEDPAHTV